MAQALIQELRSLSRSLAGDPLDRAELSIRFRQVALRLRATLPPLLLPERTGSPARRIGFLALAAAEVLEITQALDDAPSAADEQVWIYTSDPVFADVNAPQGWRAQSLGDTSELQAARVVAEADLDALIDAGSALSRAPALIALQPARLVITPLLDPPCFPEASECRDAGGSGARSALKVARALVRGGPAANGQPAFDTPGVLSAALQSAVAMHQSGRLREAGESYEGLLARYPRHPTAAYLLGQLRYQQGHADRAIDWLELAVAGAPEFRDAHYTLAQRRAEVGRWVDAIAAYRRTLALSPDFAPGWSGLGLALLKGAASASREAVDALEKAVRLDPDNAQYAFNLAFARQTLGSLAEARTAYRNLLTRDPQHRQARFNLAAVAQEQGDYATAIDAYRRSLQSDATFADAYTGLGTSLFLTGRIDEWVEAFRSYRRHCPESLAQAVYGLEASMAAGDVVDHCRWRDRILAGEFPAADAEDFVRNWEQLLFLLLHVDVDRRTLLGCYERYDSGARAYYGSPLAPSGARQPGRLRIGYLSGDLREHVMGRMVYEWVSRHDPNRFDVRLYSLSAKVDAFTGLFAALGIPCVDLSALHYRDAAERIRADDIDLLIDCSGHTRGAQPGILALRPAPIAATHIATPGPLGLRAVDYKLTDALAEGADNQAFMLERLLPVEGGVYPWRRHPLPHGFRQKPSSLRPFVCGVFVSLMKLSPRCLDLWRRILLRVPDAVLAFSPQQQGWVPAYLRWLDANGIPADRIVFLPCPPDAAGQLARYAAVDVVLDPLPCGNVNGTMEALAMGVPVITLTGLRHGERLGYALLTRFGMTETIAADEHGYIELVARLASESGWAEELQRRIRHLLVESTVWDLAGQVRQVEDAYLKSAASVRESDGGAR